jgi:hypothetical protein
MKLRSVKSIYGSILILLLALFVGCSKEKKAPVEIALQVLDKNHLPDTTLQQGDVVIFSFTMNTPSSNLTWWNSSTFESNFFEVFQKSGSSWVSIGKPYLTLTATDVVLSNTQPFFINISWDGVATFPGNSAWGITPTPNPNSPLPKGSYYTAFTHTFKFKGYEDYIFSSKVYFSVE